MGKSSHSAKHQNGTPGVRDGGVGVRLHSTTSTYQPEVVLQHLKRNHRCVSHATEAAFLRTCKKEKQRRDTSSDQCIHYFTVYKQTLSQLSFDLQKALSSLGQH